MKKIFKERAKGFKPDHKIIALKRTLERFLEKYNLSQVDVYGPCKIPSATFNGWLASLKPQDIMRVKDVAKYAKEVFNDETFGDFNYLVTGDDEDQEHLLRESRINLAPKLKELNFSEESINEIQTMTSSEIRQVYKKISQCIGEGKMLFDATREIA